MIWRALQFDNPQAIWLLLFLVPILWASYFLYRYRQKKLQLLASQEVLDVIMEKREPVLYGLKVFLFCLAWTAGVFAFMQPKGNERYVSTSTDGQVAIKNETPEKVKLRKKAHEVIVLIDASASMRINDVAGKTRLEVAKEIVDDVIRHLKGENISLFAFTSGTIQVVPSTLDYFFTRLMLQQIEINEGETEGTDFRQALEYLRKLFFEKPSSKTKTLIVLSDGGDTHLFGLSGDALSQQMNEIIHPIADATERNLRVMTIGIGSTTGKEVPDVTFQGKSVTSALEESLLRKLSIAGQGDSFVVGERTPFQIARALSQNIARDETFIDASEDQPPPDRGDGTHVYDYYFQYPLAVAILALMAYLLIPDTRRKMQKIVVLLFLLGNLQSVSGQGVDGEMNSARSYFEAENYSRAKAIYESIEDSTLDSWKRQVIDYDIGTTLLADGQLEEAIVRLEALSGTSIELPQLKPKVLFNLALAQIEQLNKQLEGLKQNPQASHEDYIRLFSQFRWVLAVIDKAHSAQCELEHLEGAKECKDTIDLQEMRFFVKSNFDAFFAHYLEYRLSSLSLQEGVSALLYGEKALLDQLNVFQQQMLVGKMKENYLADFLQQMTSWRELWDRLKNIFGSGSKAVHLDKERTSFERARQFFYESLKFVEQRNFSNAAKHLENSKESLGELLKMFFNASSIKESLQQLSIAYDLALIKEPLQYSILEQIFETQSAMEQSVKQSIDTTLFVNYEQSRKYLNLSRQSYNTSSMAKTRLLLEVARFFLSTILEQIDFTPKAQPTTILENVIAKQQFILLLNRLKEQVEGDKKELEEVEHLLPELQEIVLKAADRFLGVVLAHQNESFSKGEDSSCQCRPWDEVIPLFSDGYANAETALQRLKTGTSNSGSIQYLQKRAIDYWKEALVRMRSSATKQPRKESEKQSSSQTTSESQKDLSESQKDLSKGDQKKNSGLNEVLRFVQDMENEDRSKPQQLKTGSTKTEERPW